MRARLPATRPLRLVAIVALAGALLLGCGSASPGRPLDLPRALPASRSSHVVVIVLENRESSEVVGNAEAPYIDALAHRYALAGRYYGVTHPSLPNYLALTGGSTFGIDSDCTSCSVSATNIVDQLETAHISWRAYMEGMPKPCDLAAEAGGYAKKHDPFLYYRDVAGNPARCRHVVPYAQLGAALAAGRLPTYAWITPNLCDDGHDCSLRAVNRFLKSVVPSLLAELGPKGVLMITWDEGTSNGGCCRGLAAGGRVATILAGPGVRAGTVYGATYDHYSLLGTVEQMLGLPLLRHAASPANGPLAALFRGGVIPIIR
jgi:phosphatidylinositol-3-phosphatase